MPKAIRIYENGGPEVMRLEEVPLADPGEGEARVRHRAIGVNYLDTYHRSGFYKVSLPSGIGIEGSGVVEAVGKGVSRLRAGDRVAYAGGPPGAYAESRVIAADRLLPIPAALSDEAAASVLLKGLTVWMLVRRVHRVERGETVLFHAAAGGVGLLALQWLRALGARVIATAGSDEKAALARAHGADEVIVYTREDFAKRTRELTQGAGVRVVYDSVGQATFAGSLDCLRPAGLLVCFGSASGAVPPFDISQLAAKGSLFLTRPTLYSYTARREDLEEGARELFQRVASGEVKPGTPRTWPLARAAEAHRALEGRKTTGSIVLLP